eukprot:Em0012g771a
MKAPAFLVSCWLFSFGLVSSILCPPCDPDACLPPSCKVPDAIVYDDCGCCPECGKLEGELCGGNANVGGTCAPGLYCSYRLGTVLGSQRMGKCEPVICRGRICDYRQSCRNATGRITCFCPAYRCTGKSNPVCGNDGKTYASVCGLQEEECVTARIIGIRQAGECPPAPYGTQRSRMNAVPFCAIPNIMDRVVNVGQVLKEDPSDHCHYLACYSQDILAEVSVPGCSIDGPIELDYGVTQPYVDGIWTEWEDISMCTGPCPNGTMAQRRNCTNPPPSNEGRYCVGPSARNLSCVPEQCRVDELCGYGPWSNWSSCSVTCGEGIQTRTRTAGAQLLNNVSCLHLEEAKTCRMATCITSGNCRLRKSLQRFPGENSYRDCITIKQHSVGFECRGVCQGASCVPTYVSQNFNMSCPDGIRSVPVNVVVHCDCR